MWKGDLQNNIILVYEITKGLLKTKFMQIKIQKYYEFTNRLQRDRLSDIVIQDIYMVEVCIYVGLYYKRLGFKIFYILGEGLNCIVRVTKGFYKPVTELGCIIRHRTIKKTIEKIYK